MKKTAVRGSVASKVGYNGIVTISRCTPHRKTELLKIHNEGGLALFNYLASCLAGNFYEAQSNMPEKIMLLNIDNERNIRKAGNSNSRFIYKLTAPEKVYSTTEGIVRYSFIILPEDLIGVKDFNAIGLYTSQATESDLDNPAAICTVDFKTIPSLSTALAVDWELHISNSVSEGD